MDSLFLRTERLCRYYRRGSAEVRAVDGVDLIVHRGEFVAVVGASGSGKSTLLAFLAGLDTPTSGRVFIDEIPLDVFNRKQIARYRAQRVGMIFQSFNLLAHQTAMGNVEAALLFNDTPRQQRRALARDALVGLGMGERLDHRPADLSGGEQQRVAVARALVKKPHLLLADEPTGNLDRDNSEQISSLLAHLNGQGLTIIMVTHDLDLAQRLAHRTVRMSYGRLVDHTGTGEGR